MKSYDYANRKGVEVITWEHFAALSAGLTEMLAELRIEMVVGIARAGLFPATAIACALQKELYPIRITRRLDDKVIFDRPKWRVDVSPEVAGKVVGVVDDIADSGETLNMVAYRIKELGAAGIVTSSLVCHTWAKPMPDITTLVSDALVIFPWDIHVFLGGRWQPHPEYLSALSAQKGFDPDKYFYNYPAVK
ncbi:MAG: phosphoribosyltransferase [Anaerolineales bacterium]|nr:phosphoribosyltransferase [Anaerolineales bacterium]